MNDISSRALLVNFSISQWSGRKLDKTVTKEVTDAHAAAEDAGRFNKMLVAKEALAPIVTVAGAARLYVYAQTLPWGDNGDRVLMSSNYFTFAAKMREFEQAFRDAVDVLVTNYGEYVDRARFRLNSMFVASDYPAVEEIKDKFRMRYTIKPVPVAEDFRVAMAQDEVDEIKEQITKQNEQVVQDAMACVWEEVKTTMSHLHGKLADPKAIFKESTIQNIEELVDRLPHLNLTEDADLEAFRKEVKASLVGYTAKELRSDEALRKTAAAETQRIIDQFKGVWG